jgi:hypothetical protein
MAGSCSLRGQALYIARETALTLSLLGRLSARRPAGNVLTLSVAIANNPQMTAETSNVATNFMRFLGR